MTKQDIITVVADNAALTKADATKAVDAVVAAIVDSLKKGEDVQFAGLGKFTVRNRAARKGKNPRTGEEINIPATKTPAFVAGKQLKDAVK